MELFYKLLIVSPALLCLVMGVFAKARGMKGTVSTWKKHYFSCESHFYEERFYRKDNNWKNFTIFTSSLYVKT